MNRALFLYSTADWEEKVHAVRLWNVDGHMTLTLSLAGHSDGNCKKRASILRNLLFQTICDLLLQKSIVTFSHKRDIFFILLSFSRCFRAGISTLLLSTCVVQAKYVFLSLKCVGS
jgi:hypothetical protein